MVAHERKRLKLDAPITLSFKEFVFNCGVNVIPGEEWSGVVLEVMVMLVVNLKTLYSLFVLDNYFLFSYLERYENALNGTKT